VNVSEKLHDLVADEPPYRMDPDGAVTGGRRRAQRRTAVLSAAAVVALAVGAAGIAQLRPETPRQTVYLAGPAAKPVAVSQEQSELERIVRQHTPAGWTFDVTDNDDEDAFSANVDDGNGASRLYLGVTQPVGSLQQHPCSDSEFALDGPCHETELGDGRRLITRGPARSGPVTSLVVVIVHRDGSGVDIGNDNATWPTIDLVSGERVTPEQKRLMSTPSVNRPLPVYSLAQLVEIAKAVDAATA
jgi:hypothetical protein